jgi:hypothetical protein
MPASRRPASATVFLLPATLILTPMHSASGQSTTWQSFCYSEIANTVYATPVFGTGLNVKARMSMGPIQREFLEYLKGRFGVTSNAPFPANCARQPSADEAGTALAGVKTQAESQGKKVMRVDWKYVPDTALVSLSFDFSRQGEGRNVELTGKLDHGYCLSNGVEGPQYLSSAFPAGVGPNLSVWLNAFDRFLRGKHGFTGNGTDPRVVNPVECNIGRMAEAERLIKARSDGAQAGGRKVVDTGWKPGAPVAATGSAKDDDKEPAAAKAPPPAPAAEVRKFATDEGPAVLALCQNDRLIDGAFDCYAVQRTIYNYRLAHAGSKPVPLEELFMGEQLDCSGCLKTNFVSMWAANRAMSNGFTSEKSECVGKKFEASITAHPFPHRVKDLFEAAMKACPK